MTNFDRAVLSIIMQYNGAWHPPEGSPVLVAQALADAGLLAPNLPEPEPADDGALTWAEGDVWVEDDDTNVYTDRPRKWAMLSPHEARALGLALLAAADYSEGQA